MSVALKKTQRFKVGNWVSFPWGTGKMFSQVIEERGSLGVNGRHLYRIRFERGDDEYESFEMPDDDLDPVAPPDNPAVMRYLKEGGLVAILQSNLGGGRNQPKAWLTYTSRGDITHTFDAQRGVIGGAAVPFFALHEDRVFAGKKGQVIEFLAGFGLSRSDAEDVVAKVGTGP
ncbi:MAG TPA: hypothetical protein VMV69_14830 [Pirellulales bacterium]|nr:hypothetical protein [Pirellulales bacterium]